MSDYPGYDEAGTMCRLFFPSGSKMITQQPMSAQERRTVGSLALLYAFRMLGLFMVLPLIALYVGDLPGATPLLVGLALGMYGLTQALLQIPLGWLSDQIGRKPVIVGGLLMFAFGSVIAAMSDSITGIILGRTLQGTGAIASTVMALVADLTREEQRTKAMALVGISIGLSFAVALVVGPVVASFGGLAAVFWLTACLAMAGIAIVLISVPTPALQGVRHDDVGTRPGMVRRALTDGSLGRLNFGVFVLHFILMACFLLVPSLLEDVAGVARDQHWKIYLPALVLSIVGMVPLMTLAERGGRLRVAFLLGIALLLVALALLGYAGDDWGIYLGLWLFFVGFNYLEATLPSLVSKLVFEGGKGTAMGVFSTCQFLGAFFGGATGGLILQYWDSMALLGVCTCMVAAWFILMFMRGPVSPAAAAPVDSASNSDG
ncbi:MAG: MFS family permease [Bacteroidia bacterium]